MTLNKPQQFEMDNIIFKYTPKSKWVNVKIGKEKGRLQQKDLWMMVFMITKDKKQQDDMVTEQDREMMQFVRQHQVKATKDIKAGEMITVNCNVNVPQVVVDSILKGKGVDPKKALFQSEELSTPTTAVDDNQKVV